VGAVAEKAGLLMADFAKAISVVLAHEGGFVDDKDDPGGATNYGISARYWREEHGEKLTPDQMRALTREQAIAEYQHAWWDRYGFGGIRDQALATKILDMAVNMGAEQATLILQRSLNELGNHVTVDGTFGPRTLHATNISDSTRLVGKLVVHQSDFYRGLARSKPAMAKFLVGWLQRAAWPLGGRP
jgi:lysozyme family protein